MVLASKTGLVPGRRAAGWVGGLHGSPKRKENVQYDNALVAAFFASSGIE